MIWVVWRQQRIQLLLSTALVAAVAAVMVYFRFEAVSYLRVRGLDGCRVVDEGRCTTAGMNAFASEFSPYVSVIPLVLLAVGGVARGAFLQPQEQRGTVAEGAAIGAAGGRSVVPDDAWRVGSSYYDARGTEVAFDPSSCRSADNTIETCLHRQGITSLSATFHPDAQFWILQYIEAAIFVTLAGVLLVTGVWALRRRPL